ncbi:MAG TPA: HAD-IA family hydrolase [bacterium]|nr:HAD-IA family hydrolase [bacterium]
MRKINGVVFDFDGTIIHSFIDFGNMKRRIIELCIKYNLKPPSKNLPALELIKEVQKNNKENKNITEFKRESEKIIIEEEIKGMKNAVPYKDILTLIKKLKTKGIKIGIITRNCRKATEIVVKKFSIPYDVFLTRDDVEKVKPSPYHLEKAIEKLGVKKENTIIVGDHYFDILCGRKAGILTCGIVRDGKFEYFGKEMPDITFESGKEIEYLCGIRKFQKGKLPLSLLEYLLTRYTYKGKDIIKSSGIGVDASIFKIKNNTIYAKTDPIILVGKDIGTYLININSNDISVAGGNPDYFLSTIIFPQNISFLEIEDIFSQISNECKKHKIKWIGGHTEITPNVKSIISIGFMLGTPIKKQKNEKIKKGDIVFILKEVGIEGASIIVREKYDYLKKIFSEKYLEKVKNSIKNPGIGISEECKFLWENFKIKLMHDPTEGGISTALYELSSVSGHKIIVLFEKIPFYPPACKLCKIFNLNVTGIISSGCIIGITERKEVEKMKKVFKKRKIKFEIIGEIGEKGSGVFIKKKERFIPFPKFEKDEITLLS